MPALRHKATLLKDKSYTRNLYAMQEYGRNNDWKHWVGEVPVFPELEEYVNAVSKQMGVPLEFLPSVVKWTDHNGYNMQLCSEVSVFMDAFPFDIGRLGWADYSVNSNCQPTYGVYSRKIDNEKFSPARDQRCMLMSGKLPDAVRNACKYLVPFSHRELATAFYRSMQGNVEQEVKNPRRRVNEVIMPIANNIEAFTRELENLAKMNVEFVTNEFRQAAAKIRELVDDMRISESRNVSAVFVRVRDGVDEQYVDLVEALDVKKNYLMDSGSTGTTTYKMSALAEDLVSAMSVLSILEDGQYVARVGQKVDDRTYWIERG